MNLIWVEKVAKQKYENYITEHITSPLRMTKSTFDYDKIKNQMVSKIYG